MVVKRLVSPQTTALPSPQLLLTLFLSSKTGPAALPFLPDAIWAILVYKRRIKSISMHWHVYRSISFAVGRDTKFKSSKSLNKALAIAGQTFP